MEILTRDALFRASDLVDSEVELPSIEGKVKIRSLSAAFSNQAQSDALELHTVRGEQQARLNVAKLEAAKVWRALTDPKLESLEEARTLQGQLGPAWHSLVKAIDDASGISDEAVQSTHTRFQPGGTAEAGSENGYGNAPGDGGSDLPLRTGEPPAHADR